MYLGEAGHPGKASKNCDCPNFLQMKGSNRSMLSIISGHSAVSVVVSVEQSM